MTHDELRERLLELAYGELSPREAREVEEHAASCEGCRAELARIQGTRAAMARLPQEPAPEGGERILVAAAREAVRGRARRGGLPRWLWVAPVAAASIAVVVALSLRLGPFRPRDAEDADALLGRSRYAEAPAVPEKKSAPAASGPAQEAESMRAKAQGERHAAREERKGAPEQRAPPAPRTEGPRVAAAPEPSAPERSVAGPAAPPPAAARPADAAPSSVASAPEPGAGFAGAARAADAAAAEAKSDLDARRRATKLAAPRTAARAEAGTGGGPADAVARYEALRRDGRLRAEFRAFPGCPREPWRRLERDPDGRIVSYAWDALEGGRRLRIEAIYAADGSVAQVRVADAATGAPEPSAGVHAPRAGEVDLDAPTRCDR